jgi:hypothetical protein
MKQTIYGLPPLALTLHAVDRRGLKFISASVTAEVGVAKLQRLTENMQEDHHGHRGFDLLV